MAIYASYIGDLAAIEFNSVFDVSITDEFKIEIRRQDILIIPPCAQAAA